MAARTAYIDESFREQDGGGFYVLAAAVFDEGADDARQAMLGLRGRRRVGKVHWNEMDARDRKHAVGVVAGLYAVPVVTVGSPVARRAQERARRIEFVRSCRCQRSRLMILVRSATTSSGGWRAVEPHEPARRSRAVGRSGSRWPARATASAAIGSNLPYLRALSWTLAISLGRNAHDALSGAEQIAFEAT